VDLKPVVEYRPFQNTDPPQIVALWNGGRLGRGAAQGVLVDAFEQTVFSKPYFDRAGLLVATDADRIVGFVHAGFGPNEQRSGLDRGTGVICAVVVHPEFHRGGIGTALVKRAEEYLAASGAKTIIAGPAAPTTPFYVGLYGGVQPAGWLDSDPEAVPFFTSLGYQPVARHVVLHRDLGSGSDPVNFQLMTLRRKTQLAVNQGPLRESWWWQARFGAMDTLRFVLLPKDSRTPLAAVTVVNLELYLPKWQQQAVGLIDLAVGPDERKQGCGQALLVEVARRLRDERFALMEAQVPEDDPHTLAILEAAGFEPVDAGTVLQKSL
jgi:ribosomal protein S18 acetylase RimI-like enzyme